MTLFNLPRKISSIKTQNDFKNLFPLLDSLKYIFNQLEL